MPSKGSLAEKMRNLERRLNYNRHGKYMGNGDGSTLAHSDTPGWTDHEHYRQAGGWHRGVYYNATEWRMWFEQEQASEEQQIPHPEEQHFQRATDSATRLREA